MIDIWDMSDNELRRMSKVLKEQNKQFPRDTFLQQEIPKSKSSKPIIAVFRSADFLAVVYKESEEVVRITVNRTAIDIANRRWRDKISWDDLQDIKNAIGYGGYDAVEVYPADYDIVNVANMRHLWVLKKGFEHTWRKKDGKG